MAKQIRLVRVDDRPAARLALLTALAPSQVDADVLGEFRRIGTWLAVPKR